MNLTGIDLNLLHTLHIVLAERSVTRAARRLHVSPPAVSNALARLRELVGDPLLVRSGRSLVPTPRAEEMGVQLAAAMAHLAGAVGRAEPFDAKTCAREFTIACADHVAFTLLPRLTKSFSARFPAARLEVLSLDQALGTNSLATGDLDLFIGAPSMPRPGWRYAPLYQERVVAAVWKHHPDAKRRWSLRTFLAQSHVRVALLGAGSMDLVDSALEKLGHARTVVVSVPQFAFAIACLPGTSLVATVPPAVVRALGERFSVKMLELPLEVSTVTMTLVWHERTDQDHASKLLRELVRKAVRTSASASAS